jgi:hypothetical protein
LQFLIGVAAATVVGWVWSFYILSLAVTAVWYGGLPVISFWSLLVYVAAATPLAARGLPVFSGDMAKFLAVKALRQIISSPAGFYFNYYVTKIC